MILDSDGYEAWSKSTDAKDKRDQLMVKDSMNHVVWNQRYPQPELVDNLVMMDMRYPGQGPKAPAGTYEAILTVGEETHRAQFQIKKDPRWSVTNEDLRANFILAKEVSNLLTESQRRLMNLRSIRDQAESTIDLLEQRGEHEPIREMGEKLVQAALDTEDMIFQRKIETSQDEINYPRKFTNHLIRLYRVVIGQDNRPSGGELERWSDLQANYKVFDEAYNDLLNQSLPDFINAVSKAGISNIILPKK